MIYYRGISADDFERAGRYAWENLKAENTLGHFQRNHNTSMGVAFPVLENKMCGCGCGGKIVPPKRRWAGEHCGRLAYIVTGAIGYPRQAYWLLAALMGHKCAHCGVAARKYGEYDYKEFDVDHIIEVKAGGGGCWIDNLQLLCRKCHTKKTSGFATRRAKQRKSRHGVQLSIPL